MIRKVVLNILAAKILVLALIVGDVFAQEETLFDIIFGHQSRKILYRTACRTDRIPACS